MSTRGKITGRVTDAAGAPMAGTKVAITEGDQPFPEIAAVTDTEGRFRLNGLLPGSYKIQAHQQQRRGASAVTVIAGQLVDTEIELS